MLSVFLFFEGKSQENHLDKTISLQVVNWPLGQVLAGIENQGSFFFSYDAELIPVDSIISIKANDKKVSGVLNAILPNVLQYKSVGNHVVLYKPQKKAPQEVLITGYIRDSRNNRPLANATLYDPQRNQMTASNAQGYYEMMVVGNDQKLGLTVSKSGYRQEVVYVQPSQKSSLDFSLMTLEKPVTGVSPKKLNYPDVNDRKIVQLMVPNRVIESSNNLSLFERVPVQLSVIPGISTNGLINGNSTNNISFNLLAGYSQSTQGVEMGGLVNINRKDMTGLQMAGVANVTGRFMKGVQVAGMFNYTGLLFDGFQLAGMSNINMGDMSGMQLSGFCNILKGKMDGVQLSGFANLTTQDVDGMQLSGFLNIAAQDVNVAQMSGGVNYSNNIEGVQIAGLMNVATNEVVSAQVSGMANYAKYTRGAQISAYANVAAEENNGVQMAAFANYALDNKGIQLGLFNYADTSSGASFGFISLVKKGIHALDVSTTEGLLTSATFRTGNYKFYNIMGVGFNDEVFMPTYGIGTSPRLSKKLYLNIDITASTVHGLGAADWDVNQYYIQFSTMLQYQPFRKFGMAIGPTLNYYHATITGEGDFYTLSDYAFHQHTATTFFEQAWIGAKASIRFF